jgi:2,3-bisphosphoglycerate-independent phosphoglycerate mutase
VTLPAKVDCEADAGLVFLLKVGHTGVYDAAVQAVSETDEAVGRVYEACQQTGYILLVTSDHGNAEQMINPETGAPHTAHTTNPVPFIMTENPEKFRFVEDKKSEDEDEGALCDVAPTVLDIMVSYFFLLMV